MGLPSIKPPIRVLIRTYLAQLQKIDHSFDKADTELIKMLCDRLSITDETKTRHLISRISDDKKLDDKKLDDEKLDGEKLERVDIIFDYDLPTIKCQPLVMAYSIVVEGSDLTIKPLFNPNIRQFVNRTVDAYSEINFENNRCFPIRPDIRAETRRQRLAMLPVAFTLCPYDRNCWAVGFER
ncbi:hypothetical protein BGZ60DRAFT_534346 [Tricladium varicosporioides]|nr:hypothetical protein BGZ60DRAFT_534346 [Hymenoscyphus varicosporioides]